MPVRLTRKLLVEQSKDRLHRTLKRGDIALRHYHLTPAARRAKALELTGVDTLIDVGANTGQAGRLYRRLGFEGRIHSLEPDPVASKTLREWAAKYEPWTVEECAVGAEPGTLTLSQHENSQYNSLKPLTEYAAEPEAARKIGSVDVPVRTLDDIAGQLGGATVGLKIDVQGFEEEVLAGGAETLARARYLDIELCPVELYDGQIMMIDLMQRLEGLGFSLMAIEDTFSDKTTMQVLSYNGIYARL